MGTETERKFLVTGDSWRSFADTGTTIRQGYLAIGDETEIRVRVIDGASATLTIKMGGPALSRSEFEYAIPLEDALKLMKACSGSSIEKVRYNTPAGEGMVWEIDCFSGLLEGLMVAEIELAEAGSCFEKPDWLGREVTGDPRFYNANLATKGL